MASNPTLILASGSPQRRQLLTAAGYRFEVIIPHESAECGICSSTGPAGLVAELALRKGANVVEQILANKQKTTDHGYLIIACDTVAECRGEILGKPVDEEHARQMLLRLRGNDHRVYSGLCVWLLGALGAKLGALGAKLGALGAKLGALDAKLDTPVAKLGVLGATVGAPGATVGAPGATEKAAQDGDRPSPESPPEVRVDVTHLQMECISDRKIEEYLASDLWQGKAGSFGYQDRPGWLQITQGSESNVIGLPMELLADMLSQHRL
jgi:predicted house-cleaning NTP pyrophosphatase (Maf/HAM1 superfamily)